MNENHCPVNIYLDLSKAFDSLYYDILLSKLKHYGLQWKALQLLKSYISGRCQYVQLGDVKSILMRLFVVSLKVLFWVHCYLIYIY